MFMKKLLITIILSILIMNDSDAQVLKMATYNIRYDAASDSLNPWTHRINAITHLVQFHDFDLFGTQEGLHHQLEGLSNNLKIYDRIGVGRDDGNTGGEFSAIYFKRDKLKLVKNGDFWLSEDTTKPNKGWDAALPRICTWGQFIEKSSGNSFYIFNVHFDHRGVEARKESTKLVLQKIKEIAGTAPVIFMGDFNFSQKDPSYQIIQGSGVVKDAFELSPVKYAPNGTFNGFQVTSFTDERIDHIFFSNFFEVKRYGILTDTYGKGKFPSDHFPVMVEVVMKKKK
jgi:endonuclease/exonuclease/phosphatase family metal-dependent hydrolase